ncbi:hypothetical protein Sjap_007339 [Stephania japonica]|uniref:Uncharacterized protein n=1 Tax=Stephania japonica TaxID=461633 RepID=A0AAP0JNB3_9MAGN
MVRRETQRRRRRDGTERERGDGETVRRREDGRERRRQFPGSRHLRGVVSGVVGHSAHGANRGAQTRMVLPGIIANKQKQHIVNALQREPDVGEAERERETLDVTSRSKRWRRKAAMEKRGCDGDARQRWRSEAAMETREAASNGGAQTTEREKESERDFEIRERGHEEEKRKSPKVSRGGKEMEKTFNIYRVR